MVLGGFRSFAASQPSIITLPEGVLYRQNNVMMEPHFVKKDKLSNERYRFINVVPNLINGYGYRKPGSVVQKF